MDLSISCATSSLTNLLHPIERKGLRLADVAAAGDRASFVVVGGSRAAAWLRALCAEVPTAQLGPPSLGGASLPQICAVTARADGGVRVALPPAAAAAAATPAPAAATSAAAAAASAADAAEDPATNRKVLQLLERAGAAFTTSTHAPCRTSEDAAAVRGATLASGAKAILVRAKVGAAASEFVLVVIAADQKLDSKACKKVLGAKSISFASEAEVLEITGCVPGAVPPFGSAWGLRTLMDTSVQEQGATINFNAGLRTFSVLGLAVADYVRAEAPTVCRVRA